ncbi:MAG TPA: ABC transporter ATP-binding protein [Mycobacteriales bacterium]|nr:ABC transporter ATP-binding protein [Mycobacteriales bacterium]
MSTAVSVQGVSKRFRLYHERNQSLKAAVMRRGRASYEEFWALRDVSLDIPAGVTFGLIGENGSGKSTLLKCIARILQPDAGRVVATGKVAALLELGSGFHPELSGRENVFLNGSILGLSKTQITDRFDDIVGFAGLERFIDSPVKNYSSGMYVRLGFSVAINVDPDILLVDEVLAVGDESFQRRCAEKFSDFRRAGKTIVLVSHAMGQLRNMCDQVAWLEGGRVKEGGAPGNIVDDYVGEAHTERESVTVSEATPENRWGSGEARVERFELLDGSGRPTAQVRTGDPVTVRLHWSTTEPVERPVFGVAVHSLEGIEVTGPNTRDADLVPDKIDGTGVVDLHVPRLLLLPGTYDLSAAVYDWTRQHPYDHRHRAVRFDVEPGLPREEHGLTSLGGTWTI